MKVNTDQLKQVFFESKNKRVKIVKVKNSTFSISPKYVNPKTNFTYVFEDLFLK